jgi:uncharacterized protein YdiU (UPF0061 family)
MQPNRTATAPQTPPRQSSSAISSLDDLAACADYSLMDSLSCDPDATDNGVDHAPRQVFSGHYVPVAPTPIRQPAYIAHSKDFFHELGLADSLAQSDDFMRMFSGDLSQVPPPLRKRGWATGYALSIFGTEYYQQCPFQTGNGYGDGRAISVLEAVIGDRRWEMQLKGGGRTPYCRGADGRAVLRSSVREFLAQEHMHALGVPSSRSLTLYVSQSDTVRRPWYSEGSRSHDPDMLVEEAVAISTRVAPSFIRVGQVELFGRRARKNQHPAAMHELEQIVLHLVEREYADEIDSRLDMADKVVLLAEAFRARLASLVANWIRVGYCQGNFNSDNCAVGGFTLDYGPFGFCDVFDPYYQPWTGGGEHFALWNQPAAAQRNFDMFCAALKPLLTANPQASQRLDEVRQGFVSVMHSELEQMWAAKLGLERFDADLIQVLVDLMMQTSVDYIIFFRELSSIPEDIEPLKKSFYKDLSEALEARWTGWLNEWKARLIEGIDASADRSGSLEAISIAMKCVNPKYSLREWLLAPAYQQAARGDYALIRELQAVMTRPYDEQSQSVQDKFYRIRPAEFGNLGGFSHMSCSS